MNDVPLWEHSTHVELGQRGFQRTKEYSSSRTHVICIKPCHILHSRALSRALFFFLKHFCQCSLARNFVSFAIFENDFCITLFVVVSWRWRIRVLYEEIKTRWSVKWTECMRHTGHSEKNSFKTALCDSLFIAAIYQFICDFSGKRGKLFYNLFASWLNKYVGFRFRNGQFSFVCALTCDVWRILLIGFPDFNSISIYHPNCFCSTSKTKHWWDVLDDLFFAVLVELKVK